MLFRVCAGFLLAGACLTSVHAAESTTRGETGSCGGPTLAVRHADDTSTLLTVLSPRMVYALLEWPRMRDAAIAEGFQVVATRDPRVPDAEWRAAVQAAGLHELAAVPSIDAEAAARCGLLNHFPSSLVIRCGRTHPWPILGVMPERAWRSVLAQRRESLSC